MRLAATLVLLSAGPVLAQTSFPMVTHCTPTAVQRGTSVAEKPGINTPAKSQPVPVPSVVCGRIEAAENVDHYKVTAKDLPAGVSVSPLTIPANMTQGCLVLSATADAKVDASAVEVVGEGGTLTRTATPVEEIYFPGGGRGRFDVGMPAVAVTGPSDLLEVNASTRKVVLKPGQEVTIDVTVKRRADYDKTATLDVLLRHLGQVHGNPLPLGVTMVDGKSKTLLGTGNSGSIVLKAAADAPECTDVPICVQGYVPVSFVVQLGYASEPILVSVKK